jgi:hypothetical protein
MKPATITAIGINANALRTTQRVFVTTQNFNPERHRIILRVNGRYYDNLLNYFILDITLGQNKNPFPFQFPGTAEYITIHAQLYDYKSDEIIATKKQEFLKQSFTFKKVGDLDKTNPAHFNFFWNSKRLVSKVEGPFDKDGKLRSEIKPGERYYFTATPNQDLHNVELLSVKWSYRYDDGEITRFKNHSETVSNGCNVMECTFHKDPKKIKVYAYFFDPSEKVMVKFTNSGITEEEEEQVPAKQQPAESSPEVSAPDNTESSGEALVWSKKVSSEFCEKVKKISKNLGLPQQNNEGANWLMTVMALESAYTFSPKAGTFGKNPDETSKYKYVGLIQFGKAAAEEVGTTRTHLMSLTAEQQLDYVEKHFKLKRFRGLLKSKTALYLSVNYPVATKHAGEKDYVVYDSSKDAYDDNPMFKRESHEFWIDKKTGNKKYYKGRKGKSYVWEFDEALNEVEELGKQYMSNASAPKSKPVADHKKTSAPSATPSAPKNNTKASAKDIVTYHVYHNGIIEKHIPKQIKLGNEKKYKYVYHDYKNVIHEICVAEWHTTKEKGVGKVHMTKPTHAKIVSDENVNEGNTSRRVKYQNGDIAEYGSHPKKGKIWLLYKAGQNNVELLKMPDSLNYNKDEVSIAYEFTETKRRYTGVNSFAGFIGYLAKSGRKLKTTGSCFSEGSSFPSQEHCNGRSVDTLYLKKVEDDQKVIDSAIFFHFTEVLKGVDAYCKKLKRAGNGGTLHNSHLHSGNFDGSIVKTITEK